MAGNTNENAYKLIKDVREGVNEYSAGLWAGTDTHGKFSNTYIIGKLNAAQARMYALLMRTEARGLFYKSADATVTSSVITLPSDFGRIIQLEDGDGYKVYPDTPKNTPLTGDDGSAHRYYRSAKTLVLMQSGVSDTYTLKYYKQPRRVTYGAAASGSGLNALKMAASELTSGTSDYYNNLVVDNYTQGLSCTISDYVGSTRVATTDNTITWAENDVYGTVPDLPDEFHILVAPLAVILIKAENPAAQERPNAAEIKLWGEMFMEVVSGYVEQPEDKTLESIFCDFGGGSITGVLVPGIGLIPA